MYPLYTFLDWREILASAQDDVFFLFFPGFSSFKKRYVRTGWFKLNVQAGSS